MVHAALIVVVRHERRHAPPARARREEGEKFNVWVAWLNLENAYGMPSPEEAAAALLKRALQYSDPKRMYLAALGIFERSGREELCEQVRRACMHDS